MGCGGSKVDDLPLVTLCRERKELIRAAADHRYALASAHLSYFRSLKDVGDALRQFVDEELFIGVGSPPASPVLTLPSDEGKSSKKKSNKDSSSSTSLSHSVSISHLHSPDHDSHLHLASGSDSDSDSIMTHGHGSPERPEQPFSFSRPTDSSPPRGNTYSSYYMRKSSTAIPSVIYEEPSAMPTGVQWPDSSYSGYPQYGMGGYFGIPTASPTPDPNYDRRPSPPVAPPPSPPPPPVVSAWDFLNPFDSLDNMYPSYYSQGRYGFGSNTSSPDSKEVREREGIPDLEDETEPEPAKEARKGKKLETDVKGDSDEGTSQAAPKQNAEKVPSPAQEKEIKSSPETISSISKEEEEKPGKKGVSFEVDAVSTQDGESSKPSSLTTLTSESSKPSSLTTLTSHGTRDLREVVKEIKDEFENASDYGKEVSALLEVGKLRYQPRGTILKVISSWILDFMASSKLTSSHPPSRRSQQEAASTMKMAKAHNAKLVRDNIMMSSNLSSTLEKLYVWEKKLYKEVKDEERLRVIYERECKRLKVLDDRGAESNKIDATRASIRKLHTKLDVAIRAIDAISSRIHKLRDEELQPQLTQLIHGFIKMWKSMLKCHQKQFQAIIESNSRTYKVNMGVQRNSSLKATVELELELMNWCTHFSTWINSQKAYVESLNGWLLRCLLEEQEETDDGVVPFSPGRVKAPPAFIICNDWHQAMERLSETNVANAMHTFALSLHQLWERQDEEQRQRLKAEYLSKDFEKRLRSLRKEKSRMQRDQDALSDKTAISVVPTDSGVSPLDDLKVDLDSMKKRLAEEKTKHKEKIRQVHEAASGSLQAGLIPILEALESFSSDTLKAYEQVRIQNAEGGT